MLAPIIELVAQFEVWLTTDQTVRLNQYLVLNLNILPYLQLFSIHLTDRWPVIAWLLRCYHMIWWFWGTVVVIIGEVLALRLGP